MKKLLVGMAALSIGATAQADVKFSGDTLLRYTNTKNAAATKDNNSERWVLTNNINIDGNKGEKLSYHMNLRHVANMGSRAGVLPSAGDTNAGTLRTQENDLVFVQEAVAYAKVGENGTLAFGRSGLELNQGELISKRSFDDSNVAFDGIRYVHDADWGRLGLSYSVSGLVDNTAPANDNMIIFRGFSYTMKNTPEAISNLELHYVSASADGATLSAGLLNAANTRTWIGVNVAGEMGKFDYKLNVENFKGTDLPSTDAKATMIDLDLGMRLSYKDARISLGYHNDGTTDDGFYDALYYDNHKNAGLMDVVGWGNTQDINLKYTMKPSADCDFGIAYHMFTKVKDDKNITINGTSRSTELASTNSKSDIGSEIDVWMKHSYDSGMFVYAELGSFAPGDAYKLAGNEESITRLYFEAGFDF